MFFDYIEVYRDQNGQWRWRGKAKNGKTLADSGESYARAANLKRMFRERPSCHGTPLRVLCESKAVWPRFV